MFIKGLRKGVFNPVLSEMGETGLERDNAAWEGHSLGTFTSLVSSLMSCNKDRAGLPVPPSLSERICYSIVRQ